MENQALGVLRPLVEDLLLLLFLFDEPLDVRAEVLLFELQFSGSGWRACILGRNLGLGLVFLHERGLLGIAELVMGRSLEGGKFGGLGSCLGRVALQFLGLLAIQPVVDTYLFFEWLELDPCDIDLLTVIPIRYYFRLSLFDLLDHLADRHPLILQSCIQLRLHLDTFILCILGHRHQISPVSLVLLGSVSLFLWLLLTVFQVQPREPHLLRR